MSREKIFLKVIKGALVPADDYAAKKLRDRGYAIGDVLAADLSKLRNPAFHRLVHRIGRLAVANIEAFKNGDAHDAIKRMQVEAGIACIQQVADLPAVGKCLVTIPRSLSFSSLDEGEFREVARAICRHISEKYWPTMTPEAIEEMAESFVDD